MSQFNYPMHMLGVQVFFGFTNYTGVAEEVVLPKQKWKTEEIQLPGGIVKMPTTLEAMDVTFKFMEQTYEGYFGNGIAPAGLVPAVVYWTGKSLDGKTTEMVITMRGTILSTDPGTAKNADVKSGIQTVEMNLHSYSMTRDKIPMVVVDVKNSKVFSGPFDQMAAARKNLRLG